MNSLSEEKSAYLRHAADQLIEWVPWSEEAFERAKQKDKPLFLSSGAVWCHWCHVMAGECFYDKEVAALLNDNFINIKLDRDERPDIDRRYQMAVSAMGSGSGWPLSVFLTPDKEPFYGGTYFPPEDRMGRPGFKKVLRAVIELYDSKRDEISRYTEKLLNALKPVPGPQDEIKESLLEDAVKKILSEFDPRNGGFGTAPKFPMPGAMEFLINRYYFTGEDSTGIAVRQTLESMAAGGFYDQIGGGFHRYSTDEAWVIPHFEKMADDNAWLLRNYLHAYAVLGDQLFRAVAEGTINFIKNVLTDPDGGFYTSQDADVTPEDEGGYFTWTDNDFRRVLSEKEYNMLSMHLMHEAGTMHHDESKKVLFVARGAKEIAEDSGTDIGTVKDILLRGKSRLLNERNLRETPFIDKTLYTSINGMLISAYLQGFRILRDRSLKDFAFRSLAKTLKERYINKELFHTEGVSALLDDYVYLIEALISAYEITGKISYLNQADELMEICIEKLWDQDEGGFYDTDDHILGIRIKAVEDMPQPSANSLCIILLLKLDFMTRKDRYRQFAEKALHVFSAKAKDMGPHGGYYFCALDAYYHSLKLTLETIPSSDLAEATIYFYRPYMNMRYQEDKNRVIPCIGEVCYNPVDNREGLANFFRKDRFTGAKLNIHDEFDV